MYLYPYFNTILNVKKPVLILFIIILFNSCEKDKPQLQLESLQIEQVSEKNCNTDEENCSYVSLHTPWDYSNTQIGNKFNEEVQNYIIQLIDYEDEGDYQNLEEFASHFIANYEQTAQDFPEYSIPWEASVEGTIYLKTEDIISIGYQLALFTGGAHGYTSLSFLNINPQTGESFDASSLYSREFTDYAEKLFRERNEIPKDSNINSTGFFFEDDTFKLPNNIGFSRDKVILHYNAYEVASYAQGSFHIEIPKKEADKYLK